MCHQFHLTLIKVNNTNFLLACIIVQAFFIMSHTTEILLSFCCVAHLYVRNKSEQVYEFTGSKVYELFNYKERVNM